MPRNSLPMENGDLVEHRSNVLFIGPETEGQRISSHFVSHPLAVDLTIVHEPAAATEALQDSVQWDLVLCKLSGFENQDISSTLTCSAAELLASIVVLKPRGNAFSVAAAYKQGADDVVVVSDYEHLEVVMDRELHAARNRRALRALLHERERGRQASRRMVLPKITELVPEKRSEVELPSGLDTGDLDVAAEPDAAERSKPAQKPNAVTDEQSGQDLDIQTLLEQRALILQFQPIIGLVEGEAQGAMFEVLVRLKDENGRIIFPQTLFPSARRSGLLWDLDRLVLQEAMCTLTKLQSVENRNVKFFVNLSEESLADPEHIQQIADIIDLAHVQSGSVIIELRKEAFTAYPENMARLRKLLAKGEHGLLYEAFDLDDCEQMKGATADLDFVKLNPPLIEGVVATSAKNAKLLDFLSCMAQNGVRTIAHAVETADTLPVLYSLGIHFIQGYFVSMPYDELIYPDIHNVDIGTTNSCWAKS